MSGNCFLQKQITDSHTGPSGKFRHEALGLKYYLVIFYESTQRHTKPSVVFVHDLLKDTYNNFKHYRKICPHSLGIFTSKIILQISMAIHS